MGKKFINEPKFHHPQNSQKNINVQKFQKLLKVRKRRKPHKNKITKSTRNDKWTKMAKISKYPTTWNFSKNLETYYDRIQEKLRNRSFLEKVETNKKS